MNEFDESDMLSLLQDEIRDLHREASDSISEPDNEEIVEDIIALRRFGDRHVEPGVEITEEEVKHLLAINRRMRARSHRRYAGRSAQIGAPR